MPSAPAPFARWLDSIRAFGASALSLVESRLSLLSLELQQEKLRAIQMLIWMAAVAFTAFLAILFTSLLLVYLCWETARTPAVVGVAAFYVVTSLALIFAFRRYLARQPRPFAASLQELAADQACLRPRP